MDYHKTYNKLIDRAKERKLDCYKERHHIVPKCLGGTDEPSNIVELTAKEHFICHLLLCQLYPTSYKLRYALWAMANQNSQKQQRSYKVGSRLYERLRLEVSRLNTIRNTGKRQSDETRRRMAESRTGKKRGSYQPKELKFEHICEGCGVCYRSADIKGRYCKTCKAPRQCLCGCGSIVKTPGRQYAAGCRIRGKTYTDIYGANTPLCGFKKGNRFGKIKN